MVEYYWSQIPGRFVDKTNGRLLGAPFTFPGTVREWYETLIEVIIDVALTIERSGKAQLWNVSLYADPNVHRIMQDSVLYGWTSGCGLTLKANDAPDLSAMIDFVDNSTGEVLGTLRVLDM